MKIRHLIPCGLIILPLTCSALNQAELPSGAVDAAKSCFAQCVVVAANQIKDCNDEYIGSQDLCTTMNNHSCAQGVSEQSILNCQLRCVSEHLTDGDKKCR